MTEPTCGRRPSIDGKAQIAARIFPYVLGCLGLTLFLLKAGGTRSFDSPVRTVRVKIAMDKSLRLSGFAREEIKPLLVSASSIFNRRFGLQFLIKTYESWNPERDSRSLQSLLNDLRKKVARGDEEIVIGIISPDRMNGNQCGFTSYVHGYILIKYVEPRSLMGAVLLHELCHVFGAVDLDEQGSIMGIRRASENFDEFTRRVVLINRGRTFLEEPYVPEEEELDELILLYEQRDRSKGQELALKFALATLYQMKNRFDPAVYKCLEFLEASPDSMETYNLLGNIYHRQGNIDQAIRSYRRASELNPELPELHFNLGLAYSKKGDAESAIIEYQRAIQLNPAMAIAQANLGCLYLRITEVDRAIEACRAALRNRPDLAEALCTLGAALISKAAVQVSKGYASSPDVPKKSEESSAEVKAGQVMIEEAIACCLRSTRLKPSLAEPYNVLGMAYGYLGRTEEAEAEFLEALKIGPDFVDAHFNLGALYFRNRELEKAAFQLIKIIDADPSTGLGYQILARVYQQRPIYAYPMEPLQNRDY